MSLTLDEFVKIAANGGSIRMSARSKMPDELMKIAQNLKPERQLILYDLGGLPVSEFVRIARYGHVLFELDG